jgi:hypothetical protein
MSRGVKIPWVGVSKYYGWMGSIYHG